VFRRVFPVLAATAASVFLMRSGWFRRTRLGGTFPGPGFWFLRSEELFEQFFYHRSDFLSGVG